MNLEVFAIVCVRVCVCEGVCVSVCMCVCQRERKKNICVYVRSECVHVRECAWVCAYVCESVCVCVCACVM